MNDAKKSLNELKNRLYLIGVLGRDRPNFFEIVPDILYQYSGFTLYDDQPKYEINWVHYTAWKHTFEMFNESPCLRMYNYEHSNDPEEGKIVPCEWKKVEKGARSWLEEFLEPWHIEEVKLGGTTYGCSFSSGSSGVEDDLTYWRLYGNDGQGCSLKITVKPDIQFYRVRYRNKNFTKRTRKQKDEDKRIAGQLENLFEVGKEFVDGLPDEHRKSIGSKVALELSKVLYGYYHMIKDIAYEKEQEWRMIKVLPEPEEVKFDTSPDYLVKRYIEGPSLKRLLSSGSVVTIGPTIPNSGAARAFIEHKARTVHEIDIPDTVKIKNSEKSYRQISPPNAE